PHGTRGARRQALRHVRLRHAPLRLRTHARGMGRQRKGQEPRRHDRGAARSGRGGGVGFVSLLATVFLILLAVHVAHSLAANARELPAHRSAERVLSVAVQSPLFFLSLVYAWHADAFTRQLVSP